MLQAGLPSPRLRSGRGRHTAVYAQLFESPSRRALLGGALAGVTVLPGSPATASPRTDVPIDDVLGISKGLPQVPMAKLPGLKLSKIIKGCWQLGGEHAGSDKASNRTTGQAALEDFERFFRSGITSVDVADIYGSAETVVGQYLRLHPQRRPGLQVATKLCFFGQEMLDVTADVVEYRVRSALTRTGKSSLDLVQLYWDDFNVPGWLQVAQVLQELQEHGVIKALGVTNWDVPHLIPLLDKGIKVATNQVQYSLLDRRPALYMCDYCAKKGIALLPYGVMGGGFLSDRYKGKPAKSAVLDTASKAKYGAIIRELGGWAWVQELLQVAGRVAEKHRVSTSAVAARWVLQQRQVPAIIVGARNATHLADLRSVFTFTLDESDLLDLEAVYEDARQPGTDCFKWERGGRWEA